MKSNPVNRLAPGDVIGVAAPSARFDVKELEKGIRILEGMGFRVRVPEQIYDSRRYLAGSDEIRARVLTQLFEDGDIKAVIAARGGYGALRILPLLDWNLLKAHPTMFIGFSDATALMSNLISNQISKAASGPVSNPESRGGSIVIHGPNMVSLARAGRETLAGFETALTGKLESLSLNSGTCLIPGKATGRLVGGNLATLAHLLGTAFQPNFSDGILFLEDVGEPAYKIDRMLTQMKMAGLFDGIRGVVLGDFYDCPNPEYILEIFTEMFTPFGVPVMTGVPSGHGPVNMAFPMGGTVVLDTASSILSWVG